MLDFQTIPRPVLYAASAISGTFIFALVVRKLRKKSKPKQVPDGIVLLHEFYRSKHVPNFSPPCLKLETFLRMAEIPYKAAFGGARSSKNKLPWIEYNGQGIADSNFCVAFLSREFNVNVNCHLSGEEAAVARAFMVMIEENTFWTLVRYRWIEDFSGMGQEPHWIKSFPIIIRSIITTMAQRKVKGYLYSQGMGRHTKEEVYGIAEQDLSAVSKYLGQKPFMMGDKPSLVDCSVFAIIANFIWQLPNCPQGIFIKTNLPNLVSYCERMKERFYPDWDDLITD